MISSACICVDVTAVQMLQPLAHDAGACINAMAEDINSREENARLSFLCLLRVGTIHATVPPKLTDNPVISSSKKLGSRRDAAAFSLVEMVAVIAILVTLMTAGVSLLNGTGTQSRRAGADLMAGLIEQARTKAITSRSYVILAIAEPGDLPAGDERCRIGLFRIEGSEAPPSLDNVSAVLLNRWQLLNTGVVLIPGSVDTVENPLDLPQINIRYGGTNNLSVEVHAIAFNPRGGLHFPAGSTPVALRIAEGNYRNGTATPYERGTQKSITENRLRIGRVTARPYRLD